MAKQKVNISSDIFDEEPVGAIAKLTGAVRSRTAEQQTVPPSAPAPRPASEPATTEQGHEPVQKQTRNVKPTSIYLTSAQLRKLDQLAYEYNEQTEKRINRNDIIRYLVDRCTLEHLHGL
jgi:hypothetical protein